MTEAAGYETFYSRVPIKSWTVGIEPDEGAQRQVFNLALLPVVDEAGLAVMPDRHYGIGATIGTVVPTVRAVIPAVVGVDIGCGMQAVLTTLRADNLDGRPLGELRAAVEAAVPVGGPGVAGSWMERRFGRVPDYAAEAWAADLAPAYERIAERHPRAATRNHPANQLGTLGTGNHFIEVCLDTMDRVWVMLHSGSRGVGNSVGRYFIERAKEAHLRAGSRLPDLDLAWLDEGTADFDDYVCAVAWAQLYALRNRELMMGATLRALRGVLGPFERGGVSVNCHHNYVQREEHNGRQVWLTRKGAVSARLGELGIIPGAMGRKSFIVEGLGNPESYRSCSHGAGRRMSRGEAKRTFTLEDHARETEGLECRKDRGVLDETPLAYKDIDAVMAAQRDLCRPVHELRAVVCVKG